MRNCLVAQSGGPTVAINASLAGVIQGAIDSKEFKTVYGSLNGVQGLLNGRLMDLTKKEIKNDVILLADLFSLGKDDKLHIAGIRSGSTIKTEMKNVRIRFLISFDENAEDIIFNTILLMNMIKIYSNINFTFYSCKHAQYSLTSVIKENSFTYTVYTDTKQCLFTNVSQDPKVVQAEQRREKYEK